MNNKKLTIGGKLAKIFVHNQRLGLLVVLVLFFFGVISFIATPKQYNPEISAPAFNIITEFPGASSTEVERLITEPMEDKVKDIHGVDEVMSRSIDGGVSIVTVKFDVGASVEDSKIKIISKIFGNMDLKPQGANDPIIKEINPDDVPIITIALSSETLDLISLRKIALEFQNELNLIDGATNVEVVGGYKNEYKIIIDPGKLQSTHTSLYSIISAIESSNNRFLVGEINSGDKKEEISIDGQYTSIEMLQKFPITNDNGAIVYLEDIATVTEDTEEKDNIVRYKTTENRDQNTVFISVSKRKGENISNIANKVLEKVSAFQSKSDPALISLKVLRNEGQVASESISGLTMNLFTSIIIVSLILLYFLGSSASFIVAITIPLTLATVFGIGFLGGQTINRITLFALILSLGLLVDNSTVVIENITRHLRDKDKDPDTIVHAVDEVGPGLIMSTATTLLAFFPMAFITGMMGPYMKPIPFFVPAALVVSLVLAFTVNPFLIGKIINRKNAKPIEIKQKLGKILVKYRALLTSLLASKSKRRNIFIISFLLLSLAVLLPAVGIVKFRMLPKADTEQFYVYLDLPKGTQISKTDQIVNEIEDFFLDNKEVVSTQSFIGTAPILDFNGLFKGTSARVGENQATIRVNITHHNDRDIKSEDLVAQIRPELLEHIKLYPEASIQVIEDPPGPPVLATALMKIQGENMDKIYEISTDVENMFRTTEGIVDVDTSRDENQSELSYKINHDKLLLAGISEEQLIQTLHVLLNGYNISTIHDSEEEQHFINIRLKDSKREQITDLDEIFIHNQRGEQIPFTELVTAEYTSTKPTIYHDEKVRTVYVFGEMSGRSITYGTIDVFKKLWNYTLPSGKGERTGVSLFGLEYTDSDGSIYNLRWGGEWELTLEVFRDLGIAMMVAVFLIYFILVVQFHSFVTPILIMITIPLSLIGVLPGFAILGAIKGVYFTATSMIGVIALAGIVVNNAIIFVEQLKVYQDEGRTIEYALIETGVTRLQPILLTSLTTVLGSLTIVNDPVWAGLAWAIIFGLSLSTILTLIIFPILFYSTQKKHW